MEFEITGTVKYDIDCCNDCPFCRCEEDTGVVFDSFDEPNYDYFCRNEEAVEGCGGGPRHIGTCFSRFQKCDIPAWCPFMEN